MALVDLPERDACAEHCDVIDLCRRLVQFDTTNPPGNELACAEFVAEYLGGVGYSTEMVKHTATRASTVARLVGSGEGPGLLLCGHLDVVPIGEEHWEHNPFGSEMEGGRIWGRGCADMKGGVAAMMSAGRIIAETGWRLKGDLWLAFTAGEEGEHLGASAIAQRRDMAPLQAIIIGEPTSNEVCIAEKGALWLEFTTHGRCAHGSIPDTGRNAIALMMEFLAGIEDVSGIRVKEHPFLGPPTWNTTRICGGVNPNVVPDRCVATVDIRTVPGQDHHFIVAELERTLDRLSQRQDGFRGSVRVVNDRAPVETRPDHPAVERFCEVVADTIGRRPTVRGVPYVTDGVILAPALGAPLIICGPGSADLAHKTDEYVTGEDLIIATKILCRAAIEFVG